MQALFRLGGSALALSLNAAVLVETDGLRSARFAAVTILYAAIAAGDRVGFAEGAIDIVAGHAWTNLLFNQRISSCASDYAVSASIILRADHDKASSRLFLSALAPFQGVGQRYRFAGARRRVYGFLTLCRLIDRTPLSSKGNVACGITAAIDACGECRGGREEQGAAASCNQFVHGRPP